MYKALVTFSGVISMAKGEIKEISDSFIAKDLVKAGYIEPAIAGSDEGKPKRKKKA